MSKEKQIEEMAKVVCKHYNTEQCIQCGEFPYCSMGLYVEALYNAGYRKQSEGEWESQADGTHYCSNCGHDATYTFDGTEVCGVACTFCGAKMKGGE